MKGLSVRGLTRSHPDLDGYRQVLHDVDLDLPPGQSVALLGRSGCGKTTLLRALLLLDHLGPHDGGEILLDEQPVVRRRNVRDLLPYRRTVQYVPQDAAASLDPARTVIEQVARPLRALGIPGSRSDHEERARALLTELEIPEDIWGSKPHRVSGGQAQRVAIARALAPRPRYLLLDEPVSGLDPALRRQVLELLARIEAAPEADEQNDAALAGDSAVPAPALLVVSHDLAAVARICYRGIVMDDGTLVEDAPMCRLLSSPETPAARALRDAVPNLP
ncbi:ABC transporter ATP-binding protein [Actinomyces viscosus]|uniref:Glutathione import ATP-binding protein GsiA n=1 Tax=Actinomyces viscosus TaxID=1656 RepID=A0A3S4WLF3_ACTVI|nr:dipeptide/oligopeptide/nickel ABC transporter ATP-binding protein [Actinomyces viscosus]TFH52783.1 ABC transporter ATP-binding protein [Actinomyces viscosus]VEI18367.1 Glutathione import ATP-binding protein GsiA [Actinomyces viscosus]